MLKETTTKAPIPETKLCLLDQDIEQKKAFSLHVTS